MTAQSEFKVLTWDERPVEGFPQSSRVSRASIVYEADGEMAGTFRVEYILQYAHYDQGDPHKSEADYVGFMCFEGSIGERSGTFIIRDSGRFAKMTPVSDLAIVSGSGTEGFTGVSGTGRLFAQDEKMIISFDMQL